MHIELSIRQKIYTAILFLSLFILGTSPLQAQDTNEQIGFVVALRGNATAFDVQGNTRTLAIKSPVFKKDVLKTGPRGRIQVLFADNTIVSIGRASEIEIFEYYWSQNEKTGSMKTRVKEGVFRVMGGAITKESPQNFTTQTPAATIGIRGSMYAGKVSGDQLIVVFEGGKGIDVMNNAGSVAITKAGFGTRILSPDEPPQTPERFSAEEISDLNTGMSTDSDAGEENEEDTSDDEQTGEESEEEASDDEQTGEESTDEEIDEDQEETSESQDASEEEDGEQVTDNEEGTPQDEDASTDPDEGQDSLETNDESDAGVETSGDTEPVDGQDTGEIGDDSDASVETAVDSDPAGTDIIDSTLDSNVEDDPGDNSVDYSPEDSSFEDDFSADTDLSAEPAISEDPVELSFLPEIQEITETTTNASQDILDNTATETSQSGINIEGAFLAGVNADGTQTDFTRWTGTIEATSINGSVTSTNTSSFDFSFDMQPYDPDATYISPFLGTGDPVIDIQTRTVNLSGVNRTFGSDVLTSNLGEFAIFLIKNGSFTANSTLYGYQDLGFAGIPSPASSAPATGIWGYKGPVLGMDTQLLAGETLDVQTEISGMWLEVNWLSGKAIGRMNFDPEPYDPMMESGPGGKAFIFGDISGTTLTNVKLYGYNKSEDEMTGGIIWFEGTEDLAQFYGSQCQGIGITGSASFYDIETDQSTTVGAGTMIAAGFREDIDSGDDVSPTGTSVYSGFVAGLAEDMNNIETNRRLYMNYDPSEFCFTIDKNNGTINGALSASDQLSGGLCFLDNLNIGGSFGSAYILDDNFVAMMGDSGSDGVYSDTYTGGLKSRGNYMITTDPDSQFSDFVTWGYWEISYEDPESAGQYHLHLPGDFWIAGELTPATVIADMAINSIQGSYTGGAKGICINNASEVTDLTNGITQINVDFGTYQVSGNITFDEVDLELTSGMLSPSSPRFSAEILGATTSSVNGALYGPNANAVGGNFNADMSGDRYMGIFGANRVP